VNVLLISHGRWEFDGRLRELVNIAKNLGDVKYVTRVNKSSIIQEKDHIAISKNGYLYFIISSIKQALSFNTLDILFIDNRRAIIPGLIINFIKKPKNIILDVRELYISNEVKHVVGKIGCFFESKMIKRANIILCANKYRAEFMKKYYNLAYLPEVYENIRKLNQNNKMVNDKFINKYRHIFQKDTIKIISTSGYSVSRTNDKLVEAICKLGNKYDLFLVGGGNKEDKLIIDNIILKYNINNVYFIEMVESEKLGYLLGNCDIGIVNYHQNDLNNKYCASGKIYEFLFAGLPVVTTENIPLYEMCNEFNIGVSDNEYINGIEKICSNYIFYKDNVDIYIKSIDVEKNNFETVSKIKEKLRT
jgi:hypothetical protein